MEPLCAQLFYGNCINVDGYQVFVRENNIGKGVILSEKGNAPSKLSEVLKTRADLHYLSTVNRDNLNIEQFNLFDFDGALSGVREHILFSKRKSPSGHYYYAFNDLNLENKEQLSYVNDREQFNDFDYCKFQQEKDWFGLIVFESNQDMPAKTAYQCHQERELLELMFNKYKPEESLLNTQHRDDFTLWGSEFVNFISTVITARMVKRAGECGLLEMMTYGEMIGDLGQTLRKATATGKPKIGDPDWVSCPSLGMEILEKLGLSDPITPQKTKAKSRSKVKPEIIAPKRPRGRPRKVQKS